MLALEGTPAYILCTQAHVQERKLAYPVRMDSSQRGFQEAPRTDQRDQDQQKQKSAKTCLSTLGAGPGNNHHKNTNNSSSYPALSMSSLLTLLLAFLFITAAQRGERIILSRLREVT